MADSDFSLSASLNIQKVDVSEVRKNIDALSKSGISIPLVFDPKSIKNIPKNFKVNLVIDNAGKIKEQMEKIFSVSSVIEGLGAVVKAEVGAIRKVASDALRDNQAKLDSDAIKREAKRRAKNPKRQKAGEGFGDSAVDYNSVKTAQKRNKLLEDANQQEVENLRSSASQILEIRRKNAAAILDLQDLVNNARGTRVPGGGRGKETGPFRFFQAALNELLKVNVATKEQLETRADLAKRLEALTAKEEKLINKGVGKGTDTFKKVRSQKGDVLSLIKENEAEIQSRSIENLEKVVERFAGTTGNSADNLRGSLNTIFNSLNSLRQLEEDYKIEGIIDPKVATQIKNAKKQIIDLLQNIDSSNLSTLRTQIETDITGPLRKEFKKAQRIAGDFTKEINKLTERRAAAVVSNGGDQDTELVRNIESQIEILKQVRQRGQDSLPEFLDADANSDRALGSLRERQVELENLEKRANAANLALEKAFSVRTDKSLNTTEAAGLLDSIGQIEKIAINAAEKIDNLKIGGRNVGQNDASVISAQVEQDIRAVEDRTVFLNKALNDIDTTKLKFDNQGLTNSSDRLSLIRDEIIKLAQSGAPLEKLSAVLQEDLVRVEILKSGEIALANYNLQLDKLQDKMQSSASSADLFGAAISLQSGRSNLQKGFDSGKSEKEMDLIVNKTKIAVSEAEKLNNTYASLSSNFEKSAAKQSGIVEKGIFRDAQKEFEKYATELSKSGKPANRILELLNAGYAKFNAEAQRDIKLPPSIDKIFDTLTGKKETFLTKGQDKSVSAINTLIKSLQQLEQGGASIEEIRRQFQQGLLDLNKVSEDEKAIERYVTSLEKLRATNNPLNKDDDLFGVGKTLDNAISDFNSIDDAASKKSELTSRLAGITAEVKARQRLNTTVGSLIGKFDDLASAQTSIRGSVVFQDAKQGFQSFVNTVVNNGEDVNAQLRRIQNEFIRTRIQAAIRAEGGFLGSIAKLAGLATKRLLAFVGIARITFAIQQAFTEAVSAGLELEVQTNKLEQVFSKTFVTEQNLAKQTREVTDEIFKMSQEYGVAVGEVTQAARILAQAGFAGQALAKSLEAISKANLTATFNDINETTEASIAILNQFKLEADELEDKLGGINRVSSLYAVESEGIAKAVRKAGGAFRAAGGSIEEFVGAFTIMKKETREADEALATGLRNIAIRIQRASVQNKVGGLLGINFKDERGQFIGITNALTAVSSKLKELNIQSKDPRFAQVVESLAGARQFARLIPLLQQFDELNEISQEFTNGAGSLDDDASRALTTINNKMEQLRSTFAELSQAVLTSDIFKTLLDSVNLLVKGLNTVVRLFDNMNVLLLAGAAIALPKIFTSGAVGRFISGAGVDPFGAVGSVFNRNSGGIIPGRGANRDTVPAMLTMGEYVIQRDAVDKYGVSFFDKLNSKRVSKPAGFNRGGRVGYNAGSPGGVGGSDGIFDRILRAFEKGGDILIEKFNSQIELGDNLLAVRKREEQASEKTSNATTAPPLAPFKRDPISESGVQRYISGGRREPLKGNGNNSNEIVDRTKVNYNELLPKRSETGKSKSKVSNLFDSIARSTDSTRQKISSGFNAISGNIESKLKSVDSVFDGVIKKFEDAGDIIKNIASGAIDISSQPDLVPRSSGSDIFESKGSNSGKKSKITIDRDSISSILNAPGEGSLQQSRISTPYAGEPLNSSDVIDRSRSNAAAFAQPRGRSGSGKITDLLKGVTPVTSGLLKLAGSLGLGATALSMFANITENASLKSSDWAAALATGAATYFTTITLFKTLNGVLATANLRLAAQNAKGFLGNFRKGADKSFIGPLRQGSAASFGRSVSNIPGARIVGKAGGSVVNSFKNVGSSLKNLPLLGRGISSAVGGLARFGGLLAGSGGVLAPVVAGFASLTVVTKALGSAAAANAQTMLNEAKTREEAAIALDKFDFADRLSSGFGVFTAIGKLGAGTLEYLKGFGEGLYNTIPGLSTVTEKISGLGDLLGSLLPESEKVVAEQKSRRSLSSASFDLQDVQSSIGGLASKDAAKRSASQSDVKKGLDRAAKNILDGVSQGAKAQGIKMSDFIKGSDVGLKAAKDLRDKTEDAIKNGVKISPDEFADIQKILNIAGLSFDPEAASRAVTAIDNMSLLFLRLEVITQQAANRMQAVEANLGVFDQTLDAITGQSFNFQIPDQVFDLIDKGINPSSLGLSEFSDRIKAGLNSINPAEAAAFNLEFGAQQLSRKMNENLAATGDKITFDPDQGGADGGGVSAGSSVANELIARAAKNTSGPVLQAYDDFMTSKAAEFEEQANAEGASGIFTLTAETITRLNQEFADSFKKGAIENLKKRFQIESDFTSRYSSLLSKRFELENKFVDQFKGVIDKEKSIIEFQNKLTRPEGSDADLNGRQAAIIDQRRLGNSLRGTGLSAGSSVDDIRAALRGSQARLEQLSLGRDNSGNAIDARTRTLGSQREVEVQQRLTTALELMASGGEKGAAAMRAFEKASEEAKKSSESFLNTFLGTDEELMNAGRAASLFRNVINNGSSKGAFAARETLRGADQSTRQALDKLLSENTKMRDDLSKAIGVGGQSAQKLPEAADVQSNLSEQLKAQRAIAETTQRQIASMDGLANVLSSQENNAIQLMTNQINQAAVIANDMTKNLANIPTEIAHTHKVADINVNFVGAANLGQLQEGFKSVIINTIKQEIANSNAKILRNNPNLNPF